MLRSSPSSLDGDVLAAPALPGHDSSHWFDEGLEVANPFVEPSAESGPEAEPSDDPVRLYLQEIHQVPLLTAADEKRLACRLEEAVLLNRIRAQVAGTDRFEDETAAVGRPYVRLSIVDRPFDRRVPPRFHVNPPKRTVLVDVSDAPAVR